VTWVPGGGHIGKVSPGYDSTLKKLAFDYGMADINSVSPSRLNRAMPKIAQPRADMPTHHFAPGFAAPYSSAGPTCAVSEISNRVSGRVTVGAALPTSQTYLTPQQSTQVVARTSGAAGTGAR
jgi:hypothetical protein